MIDAHTHLGPCRVFDLDSSEDDLLRKEKENGIDSMIIQPYPGAPDPVRIHNSIAKLSKDYPGKIFGLVSLNPHMDKQKWMDEVERLIKDEHFVGIKIHTIGHAVNPLGNDATMIFETAKRLGAPVMVHTGPGIPFALPSLVIPRAMQYPDVPIILAHAGWGIYVGESAIGGSICKNIFVEPSHVGIVEKSALINGLGPERILLGSDVTENIQNELSQFRSLVKSDGDLEKIFEGNARKVFHLGS